MRVGACIFNQNYNDWDRYEAEERGKAAPKRASRSDRDIFNEEIEIARIADDSGFDSVWTIEHHFTPYTMVTNPQSASVSDLHSRNHQAGRSRHDGRRAALA
jgi:hypothetical protein